MEVVIKVFHVQKFVGQGTEGISHRAAGDVVRPRSDGVQTPSLPACPCWGCLLRCDLSVPLLPHCRMGRISVPALGGYYEHPLY